jgi:hypothetical protein
VLINDVTDFNPFLNNLWAKLLLASSTEVLNGCLFRTTGQAEVVEKDVNLKFLRQLFSFVLTNILRRQLHFSRHNVVAMLNKSRIEHNSAECMRREPLVSEENFDVTAHRPSCLLLLCQDKRCHLLVLLVLACRWEGELLRDFKTSALVHFEVRGTAVSGHCWDVLKLNSTKTLDARRLYLLAIEGFKVIQVTKLAGLAHTLAACKSLMTVEPQAVINIVEVANKQKNGGNRCTRASFA